MLKIAILLLGSLLICSCENELESENLTNPTILAEAVSAFECINSQADNPPTLVEAKKRFIGKWQLKSMITMLPTKEIPNIILSVTNNQSLSISKAGKVILTDSYEIKEEKSGGITYLKLTTNKKNFDDEDYNFVYGTLSVCEKELLIDNGIAFDAPGYLFRKIE